MRCLTPKVCVLTALVLSSFNARVGIAQQRKTQTQKALSVYDRISPSVVTIVVSARDGAVLRSGSGIIVSTDGIIVTNYHVVEGGVFFDVSLPRLPRSDEEAYRIATTPGAYKEPGPVPARPIKCGEDDDLAALRITPEAPLRPVRISSTLPGIGTKVFALGSPYQLEGTLSEGIVSQVRHAEGSTFIQTTAAISPGSSGGGLFLESGELIGITTMSIRGGQGLNFAIPAQSISRLQPCGSFPAPVAAKAEPAVHPSLSVGGVEVKLEMSKDELLPRFDPGRYALNCGNEASWPDGSFCDVKEKSGNTLRSIGRIQFDHDKVVVVQRRWNAGNDRISAGEAFFSALSEIMKGGGGTPDQRDQSWWRGSAQISVGSDSEGASGTGPVSADGRTDMIDIKFEDTSRGVYLGVYTSIFTSRSKGESIVIMETLGPRIKEK